MVVGCLALVLVWETDECVEFYNEYANGGDVQLKALLITVFPSDDDSTDSSSPEYTCEAVSIQQLCLKKLWMAGRRTHV